MKLRRPTPNFAGHTAPHLFTVQHKIGKWMVRLTRSKAPAGTPLAGAPAGTSKRVFVGTFADELEAAAAHDAAALEAYGADAVVNLPQSDGRGTPASLGPDPCHFRGVVAALSGGWTLALPPGMATPPGWDAVADSVFDTPGEAGAAFDAAVRGQPDAPPPNFPTRAQLATTAKRQYPAGQVLPALLASSLVAPPPTSTDFVGVERSGARFRARVRSGEEVVSVGTFASAEAAAAARDAAALDILGPAAVLNFPLAHYAPQVGRLQAAGRLGEEDMERLAAAAPVGGRSRKTSPFRGVQWSHHHDGWRARVSFRGKLHLLGTHRVELQACAARDAKCMELGVPSRRLNFTPEWYTGADFLSALWVDLYRLQHGEGGLPASDAQDAYSAAAAVLPGLPHAEEVREEAVTIAQPTVDTAAQYLMAMELAEGTSERE